MIGISITLILLCYVPLATVLVYQTESDRFKGRINDLFDLWWGELFVASLILAAIGTGIFCQVFSSMNG